MICRACGNTLTRRHKGLKCRKCHARACSAARARDVADSRCCRMSGVASHESPSHAPSRQQRSRRNTSIDARHGAGDGCPDGGSADCGRAVRSANPDAYRLSRHGSCAHGGREMDSFWPHRVRARRSHRAVRKPRTPQQCSLDLRRRCWSWRRTVSGTRRGV